MRVDKGNTEVAYSDMHEHPIKGTTNWISYDVAVDVPKDADEIFFGFLLFGTGEIWLSGTQFQIVDANTGAVLSQPDATLLDKPSNLDFQDSNAAVVQWIKDNAIRLRTVQPRSGFSDMEPLKKVIGGSRIVELGEATHGTHEFFQLKHRMLEFLVRACSH